MDDEVVKEKFGKKKKRNLNGIFKAAVIVIAISAGVTLAYNTTKNNKNETVVDAPSVTQSASLATETATPTEEVENKKYTALDLLKFDNSSLDSSYKDYMDYLKDVKEYPTKDYPNEKGVITTINYNEYDHVFTNGKDSGEIVFDMTTMREQNILKKNTIHGDPNGAVGCIGMWKLNLPPDAHQDVNIISAHTDAKHNQFGNFYNKYSQENQIKNNKLLIVDGNVVEARAILDVDRDSIYNIIENTSIESFAKNSNLKYDKDNPSSETITAYNNYINDFFEKNTNKLSDNEVNNYLGEFNYDIRQNGDLYFVNYCFNSSEGRAKNERGEKNERMVVFEKVGIIDNKLIRTVYDLHTDEDYSKVGISFDENTYKWTGNSDYIRFNKDGSITVENFDKQNKIKEDYDDMDETKRGPNYQKFDEIKYDNLLDNMNSLFAPKNPKLGALNTGRTFV